MSAHASIQRGLGTAFNVLSRQFRPNAVVSLIKASDPYDEYDSLLVISNKRFFEYQEGRSKVFLQIANNTDALTAAMAEATHIKIEVADDYHFYAIVDGSKTPPDIDESWDILADLFERSGRYANLGS